MSTTRIGKIGRLPKSIRDNLGRRIEDGEQGKELVKWLNGLPRVQEILKEQFGGRAVTEQNLSDWKNQGGYQDWLRQEERRFLVADVTEQHNDLEHEADGMEISDRFGSVLSAELIRLATKLLEKETDPEKSWQHFCEVHRELSRLRRDDHRAVRTAIKRHRWNRETERENEEAEKRMEKENKERLRGMCFSALQKKTMAEVFGGGEQGEKMAELLHCIKFDLPLPDFIGSESGQSNPIQPNPS